MSYTRPGNPLNATWGGSSGYSAPGEHLVGSWRQGAIYPVPFRSSVFGSALVTKPQPAFPVGWSSSAFASPFVTLDWQYPPQFEVVRASWVGAAAYTPASGLLNAEWTKGQPKTVQYADPHGFDAQRFGTTAAKRALEYLYPSGSVSSNVGAPLVWNRDQHIAGAGAIQPRNAYGATSVWLYTRYLKPGGADTQAHGTQWASHYLRYVTAAGAGDRTERGTPWVSRSPRDLAPSGIVPPEVMESHVVGGTRYLAPAGTEMTQWGTRIIPEGQVAYPRGFVGDVGAPDVQLHTRYLQASGFQANPDDLRFGRQDVWNLRQIVRQDYDQGDGLNPPGFGQWTGIENRNKEPVPVGWLSERHGYQFIWNKAVLVAPAGVSAPADPPFYQAGSVTHWRRAVAPEGLDSLAPGRWHAAFNKADVLQGRGAEQQDFGRPALENRSRLYDKVGNFDTMAMGTPMVSDAVRTLSFESRYSIEPPALPLPNVKLHTRYVEYTTVGDKSSVGMPVLEIRWTYIAPKWAFHPPAFIGEPALRNVTPELHTGGANHEEFGQAAIRTQWRRVETQYGDMAQWGRPTVRDRRQWAEFVTVGAPPNLAPGPVVTKVGGLPDPQGLQPRGIETPELQVSAPVLNVQQALVRGWNAQAFATPVVALMGARVDVGVTPGEFGMPGIGLRNRVVSVQDRGIDCRTVPPPAAVSPHTIYAVVEAPAQAIENHPRRPLHYVDYDGQGRSIKGIGSGVAVGHKSRTLRLQGFTWESSSDTPRVPQPAVELGTRYIEVPSAQPLRMGVADIRRDKEITTYSPTDFAEVGAAAVAHAPWTGPITSRAEGIAPPSITSPAIDHRHRTRSAPGWDSMRMGGPVPGDTPYQWQGLRVGPLVPTIPEGADTQVFGTPWVSLAVRDLPVQGFDAFACEYDIDNFDKRMRVKVTPVPGPAPMTLSPAGVPAPGVGAPSTRMGAHYIRPDGNAETYRKGAP